MNLFAEPSQPLVGLALAALDHGVESVAASGGPMIPFIIVERDGVRGLGRVVADRLEQGVAIVRDKAAQVTDAETAVAFDGCTTAVGNPIFIPENS